MNTPGGTEARLAVERQVRERGWRFAASPAEANLLVVAGPAAHALEPYLDRVWRSIPAPRARADIPTALEALNRLEEAVDRLRDADGQCAQAEQAAAPAPSPAEAGHSGTQHEQHGDQHEQHGDHGQHGHEGHDMGGMEMPGGIPMAERAEDRDGLMLDQLHLPLGPVLPDWPAGLVLETTMQGDVLTDVGVHTVGLTSAPDDSPWNRPWRRIAGGEDTAFAEPARWELTRQLDTSATLLTLAGWDDAASEARRLRDGVLRGESVRVRPWARRVRRSRTLHWLLSGLGTVPGEPGTPPSLTGDAFSRLTRWLDAIGESSEREEPRELNRQDGERRLAELRHETQWTLEVLPELLRGTELASARLIVASLGLDLDLLPALDGAGHD